MADSLTGCVRRCLKQPEFVAEYNRLCGASINKPLAPIYRQVDLARLEAEDLHDFIAFVAEHVWLPLVRADVSGAANG